MSHFKLDFSVPFEVAVKDLKTNSMKPTKIKKGSDNYMCLKELFRGRVIDDYENAPLNRRGVPMRNVKSRISELTNKYEIDIKRKTGDNRTVSYWIDRG